MRAYTLIEPPIYGELGWDLDLIVKCLEVIRLKIPQIIVENDEYDLIAVGNPHGKPYPAIGWFSVSAVELNLFEIEEKIEILVREIGISNLIKESQIIDYIDWSYLEVNEIYPLRNVVY